MSNKSTLNVNEIMDLLPHRHPFLLIDRVLEVTPGESILAYKNISISEDVFNGHFPGAPIFPGVMIIEAMAQASGILGFITSNQKATDGKLYLFAGASGAIGHLSICDNVHLTVCTLVTKNITEPGSYSSGMIPTAPSLAWKKNALRFGQLDVMARRLKILEKKS